jgi:hypothetical protein
MTDRVAMHARTAEDLWTRLMTALANVDALERDRDALRIRIAHLERADHLKTAACALATRADLERLEARVATLTTALRSVHACATFDGATGECGGCAVRTALDGIA